MKTAAWVIGTNGQHKKEIESLSGAKVKIHNSLAGSSSQRQDDPVLTLKGKEVFLFLSLVLFYCH